jgi:hypothetical protein
VVDGAGVANQRFAVADADWKSVGRAWTPESNEFAAEQVEITGMAAPTKMGNRGSDEAEEVEEGPNLIPTVTTRGRRRSPGREQITASTQRYAGGRAMTLKPPV